eukprot:1533647-Pleurochrysis_carterae.AAC.1
MAADSPSIEQNSPLRLGLTALDVAFASAFAIEMLLKMLAYSLINATNAYLHSAWNRLDAFVVFSSVCPPLTSAKTYTKRTLAARVWHSRTDRMLRS